MKRLWILFSLSIFGLASFLVACGNPTTSEKTLRDGGSGEKICVGEEGCACYPNKTCDEGLICRGKVCLPSNKDENPQDAGPSDTAPEKKEYCQPGTAACRCLPTSKCYEGLRCDDDICQVCERGTANCSCKKDNTCQTGLKCQNGRCLGCVGKDHCPCYSNNSCDKGYRCVASPSNIGICKRCKKGQMKDCQCESDKDCGDKLVCINKRCQDLKAMQKIPVNPKCYSPCDGDIKNKDGTLRICHPTYHLVSGCLVGQVCDQGSCINKDKQGKLSANAYPYCKDSTDCPLWQACIQGRCYSTCTSQSDCPQGLKCDRYVCRRICTTKEHVCGSLETCETKGSDSGVCVPRATRYAMNPPQRKVAGTFQIINPSLELSNHKTIAKIFIYNKSPFPTSFQISRLKDSLSSKKPLYWLKFDLCKTYSSDGRSCVAFADNPSSAEPFKIPSVGSHKFLIIRLMNAGGQPSSVNTYTGTLAVVGEQLGSQEISLRYRQTGDGQWQGTMISFGNFEDKNIDKFPASSKVVIRDIPNALLRRWLNFKRQNMSFTQFKAVLTAIREGSWRLKKVQEDCKRKFQAATTNDVICYPYISKSGYEILSYSNREAPVPSGISELSLTVNLKEEAGNQLVGRISTAQTLHYSGNPKIVFKFDEKPGKNKLSFIKFFEANIQIGGRYSVSKDEACADPAEYKKISIPWLIPGFESHTWPTSGLFREKYECRSVRTPLSIPNGASSDLIKQIERYNLSLSAANPIPNGRILRRKLELVDGALIENRYLFVIYREKFISFFSDEGSSNHSLAKDFVQYGYFLLKRSTANLEPEDYRGSNPPSLQSCGRTHPCKSGEVCLAGFCHKKNHLSQVTCDPETVKKALNKTIRSQDDLKHWSSRDLAALATVLVHGQSSQEGASSQNQIKGPSYSYYDSSHHQRFIHYLCVDSKIFDGGASKEGEACPVGSKVIFFESADRDYRKELCNINHTCDKRYRILKGQAHFRENVPYRCEDPNKVFCDVNRKDLRQGKIFFKPSTSNHYISPYNALRVDLIQAFRYRLKFVNRSGSHIGFTPAICQPDSNLIPYCYDPRRIEELEKRVNCIEALYTTPEIARQLTPTTKLMLKKFLILTFSYKNHRSLNGLSTEFGFEMLNAELKIMLGDEAYTQAFSSRYDLSKSQMISFEGDKFEPKGIRLSGALGYEMHKLYQSTQYYQMVLDRFFSQASVIYNSFANNANAFITVESVTSYFEKLLLASTRKSRSWSQIAQRYHKLNRADLAKHVIERAYTTAYIEKTILTRVLRAIAQMTDARKLPLISHQIDKVNLTYKSALLGMEEVYKKLSGKMNFLGIPEGYIPFPALDHFSATTASTNAFTVALRFAKEKLAIAERKEQLALNSKRAFDTDSASFQSELVRIQQNYESQLLTICGGLKDGNRIVPAIPKYAYLTKKTAALGNPCGFVEGGQLYEARANLEKVRLNFESMKIAQQGVVKRIYLEEKRIKRFCNAKFELAQITWNVRKKQHNLTKEIKELQARMEMVTRLAQDGITMAEMLKCSVGPGGTDCPGAFAAIATIAGISLLREGALELLRRKMAEKEDEVAELDRNLEMSQIKSECNICDPTQKGDKQNCKEGVARIESQIKLEELRNSMLNFHLEALKAEYDIRIALSQIKQLEQRARRLITQQQESEQMAINVQAARNDPNVRIYKNDAIITAERTFEDAMREAYRATLIYEYYTGSSYKRRGDLFLIRMVSYGDKNLEAYLSQLEQAYRAFEEENGKPDIRVIVLSLRDDILKIPKIAEDGTPRTLNERVQDLQRALTSRKRLNNEGITAFPFTLSVMRGESRVSPVTVNHKILYIEAEIVGGDIGDAVGRIYLRQKGTGVIRLPNERLKFYALPVRTAVLNPFFNGSKVFDHSVYKNYRLRDRPLGNTHWELLLNQVSEKANQDINLNSVNDIKIYIYYTDFTEE